MKVRFDDRRLSRLETDTSGDSRYQTGIPRAYRKVLNFIRQAIDERAFRSMRSLRFETLQPPRSHQCSMRLNEQWRLILEFEGKGPSKVAVIIAIEDYH